MRLPWPPSMNHYWLSLRRGPMAGRVVISGDGKAYRKAVGQIVIAERVPRNRLTGKLAVYVVAFPPDRRARDLDNLWKAMLDSIRHAAVIVDDSEIDDLHVVRGPVRKDGEIVIEIREIQGGATVSGELFGEKVA
jgi:crossover junction endodeoxyribonuclease RusA